MALALVAVIFGLLLLVWSADRFVDGAAATAGYFGMPPLLIGMLIVGFGTSAPEMVVSALSSYQGNPGIALGNAYGSNISNIALILGVTALICPINVQSTVLKKELPMLILVTLLSIYVLYDMELSRMDAGILLGAFSIFIFWSLYEGFKSSRDNLGQEVEQDLEEKKMPLKWASFWLVFGMFLLVVASRILVWGAVIIARGFGVSDLIIGLTIIAIGTSLPELASSVAATYKGEHDIALGNVIGSNMFNTLAVVGIAGAIHPLSVDPSVLTRDMSVMSALTVSLFFLGIGIKGPGRINRFEGFLLLASYIAYTAYLVVTVFQP